MTRILQLGLIAALGAAGLQAQECQCGAPCDLVVEHPIAGLELLIACNTTVALGAEVTASGIAEVTAGQSVTFWNGFSVLEGGQLTVTLDPLLTCDQETDFDADGVDECLDCDDADPNVWDSCGSCVDGDGDGAWSGCNAYTTIDGPDCADQDFDRKPGATETCNTVDDNCNGLVDECLLCSVPISSPWFGCPLCGPDTRVEGQGR